MRLIIAVLIVCVTAMPAHAVKLNKGQSLACGAIMCAIGINLAKSRSKCIKVLRDWNIHLATLGPFRSTPKCPMQNQQGATEGYKAVDCSIISDPALKQMCEGETNTKPAPGYYQCNQLADSTQQYECENSCDQRYKDRNGSIVCQIQ